MSYAQPHEVFFRAWSQELDQLLRRTRRDATAELSLQAMRIAQRRAETHARNLLRWPKREARLSSLQLSVAFLYWMRFDGSCHSLLRKWLESAQEIGRAQAALPESKVAEIEPRLRGLLRSPDASRQAAA
jgi:hypothetical protein